MTIDELKKLWGNIDAQSSLPPSSAENIERRVVLHLVASTRDSLSSQFFRMAMICAVLPFLFLPFWTLSRILVIGAICFSLVQGSFQYFLGRYTDRIDLIGSTVTEALRRTVKLESMRGRFRTIGILMGLPLLAWFGYVIYLQDDMAMFIGYSAGVVIGAIIGLVKNARLARKIKQMKEELIDIE